jgi:cysteine synthase
VKTGGTISGIGHLKEEKPNIKTGIDTYGSIFKNTMKLGFSMKV